MTTVQDQQSRAEFEKAMRAEPNHWVNRDFYRDPLGVDLYEDRGTQAAWSAWQAARALPAGMEPLCYLRPAAATTPARAWQAWENDGTAEPVYTAAQVQAMGRAPLGWADDQMIRFAWMCVNPGPRGDSISERLELFREHEALRGIAAPRPPAAQEGV